MDPSFGLGRAVQEGDLVRVDDRKVQRRDDELAAGGALSWGTRPTLSAWPGPR
jgi:hypothetical protein